MEKKLWNFNICWFWICVLGLVKATSHHNQLSHKTLHGCNSVTGISTNLFLENLFTNQDKPEQLRLVATLDTYITDKGCGRSSYNALASYHKCGFHKTIALLPTHIAEEDSFVKYVARDVSPRGSLDYVFDGGTAVRYPPKQLPNNWFDKYTISTWVYADAHNERQYILSWSDGDTPHHQNMGFYVNRKPGSKLITFGFFHTHEEAKINHICMLRKKWNLDVDETRWHFVSLSFARCSVEFSVDGKVLTASTVLSRVHVPEKHIQPKFVIGARWMGSVTKYSDYLHGRISGLMLSSHETADHRKLECLLQCKEKISLSSILPSTFAEDESSDTSLVIVGSANKKQFQNIINDIIYTNDNDVPFKDDRSITIIAEQTRRKERVQREVTIKIDRPVPSIVISGMCGGESNKQQNMRVCPGLKMSITGCTRFIDSMEVKVNKALEKRERLFITAAYLVRYGLKFRSSKHGLVVYGVARLESYTHILRHIRYAYSGSLAEKITRTFTISTSSYNGLIKSNTFEVILEADLNGVIISPSQSLFETLTNEIEETGHLIHAKLPDTIFSASAQKLPKKNNKSNGGIVIWVVLGCVFGAFALIPLVVIGYRRYSSGSNVPSTSTTFYKSRDLSSTSNYMWDEEGLPTRIKINPLERVSIMNDPYVDILLKKAPPGEASTTDGSVYSDEEETDFDNDSIRQLEWDCLENSLNRVLDGDDRSRCSSTQGSRAEGELYPEEVFI